ncbi:MAG: SPOR domain-containing protein [Flavobacterium sp.]|nr:SPOR domain-containing protein [Flavobacterium sp.]
MKKALNKLSIITAIAGFAVSASGHAQSASTTLKQDPAFEQLLAEKRKINSSITVNDRYKIQVFNGDSETSKKHLAEVKRNFKQYDATIVFSTPSYKVWVGNFKSRIEAERALNELKKKYPNALMIKPNK